MHGAFSDELSQESIFIPSLQSSTAGRFCLDSQRRGKEDIMKAGGSDLQKLLILSLLFSQREISSPLT